MTQRTREKLRQETLSLTWKEHVAYVGNIWSKFREKAAKIGFAPIMPEWQSWQTLRNKNNLCLTQTTPRTGHNIDELLRFMRHEFAGGSGLKGSSLTEYYNGTVEPALRRLSVHADEIAEKVFASSPVRRELEKIKFQELSQ